MIVGGGVFRSDPGKIGLKIAPRGGRGPKMNTPVFPGSNNLVLIAVSEEDAARIQRAIRRLQGSFRLKPGVAIFSQDVEELI